MKNLGIACCGLACCLCAENAHCSGCNDCRDHDWCEVRKCAKEKNLQACYQCDQDCHKGILSKIKPYAFTQFARKYGVDTLLDCLARNEKQGVVYHVKGVTGDYDNFDDVQSLLNFIQTGKKI